MIDGVISFATFVGKRTELRREETDFAALVEEVARPLRRIARTRKVTLAFELAQPLPLVALDQEQMSEAVHHLIHNAIKFNKAGGSVQIACDAVDSQLAFSVEDTGCGVAPDKLRTLWEAFSQTADDVQRGVEGMGLGLALVRYVVEAHRGEVFATSVPGEGSLFGFRIPLE